MDDQYEKTSGLDEKDLLLFNEKTSGLDKKNEVTVDKTVINKQIIYGLVFYFNESLETPYLEMVSLDINVLEKNRILLKDTSLLYKDGELRIEPVRLIAIMKVRRQDVSKRLDYILFGKESNLLLMTLQHDMKVDDDKIYAMNLSVFRHEEEHVDQILLKIIYDESYLQTYEDFVKELRDEPFFKYNTFSSNMITFDTYYDEGIINS